MRLTMMPLPAATETPTSPAWLEEIDSLHALAALDITDAADLFAHTLPGETAEEAAGRLAAAGDILDDRLAEIAHHTLTPEVLRGWAQ